ncbi:MAG: hypothetical protein HGB10_05555 [Coriobacteriia bacterium]|nr:hypothetical protein [Coriobacteriia bacterium]
MTKRTVRLIVVAAILLLILVLLGGYFFFYKSTKKLSFDLTADTGGGFINAPTFLYAFSGVGTEHLQRPIGIAYANGKVYVVDTQRPAINMFDEAGKQLSSFGASQTANPLYTAVNPKDNTLYVTDRGKRKVLKFSLDGKYLGEFDPKLPKAERPKGPYQWAPLAIGFAPDGTMYVTEVLKGHRLLIFGPDGKFQRSVGNLGIIADPAKAPNVFQFPNGLAVSHGELYVSDSNNRRLQVFTLDGKFKRFIITEGLPRGVVDLERFLDDPKDKDIVRMAVVDTLAHYVTIWAGQDGKKIVSFGEQGALDGQFSYPSAIARGTKNKLFVTDSANGRVEVWGWEMQAAALPIIGAPTNLAWCCLPFLFLPLLLLFRKRRFFATADFVERMIELGEVDLMPDRRRQWVTLESEFAAIQELSTESMDFESMFEITEYSESDAKALMEKYEIDLNTASILAAAQRAGLFCTEQPDYRRLARTMEIPVLDAPGFIEKFAKRKAQAPSDDSQA